MTDTTRRTREGLDLDSLADLLVDVRCAIRDRALHGPEMLEYAVSCCEKAETAVRWACRVYDEAKEIEKTVNP